MSNITGPYDPTADDFISRLDDEDEDQHQADREEQAMLDRENDDDDLGISDDNWACGTLDPET